MPCSELPAEEPGLLDEPGLPRTRLPAFLQLGEGGVGVALGFGLEVTLTLTLTRALTNACPRGWRGQGGCGEEAVGGR